LIVGLVALVKGSLSTLALDAVYCVHSTFG
jgi:hypothetical protein